MTWNDRTTGPKPLAPPFADRFFGDDCQARIDAMRGGPTGPLMHCSICDVPMTRTDLGAHVACLGIRAEPYAMDGPRISEAELLLSAAFSAGTARAIREAEEARAAEAAKAAMPAPELTDDAGQSPEMFEPDLDTQRRITKEIRRSRPCRLCRRPMVVSDLHWRDAHFICEEAERQGVTFADVYALQPQAGVKGRKSRDLANVIWSTTTDDAERHWTDWAAAMAALNEGDTDR